MMRSPNRPCGRNSRKISAMHIGEPVLDAAAEQRAPVEFADLLADADDEAADDGAGDRGEAAENEHRQRLERDDLERERTRPSARPT